MAPKRKNDGEEVVEAREARPSRAAKAARTAGDDKDTKGTKEKATRTRSKKEPLPSKEKFKEGALPLHVNLMHNPPPIDQVATANETPGFLGHIVLAPSVFSTRSYGWKGSKRLQVQLENSEGPEKTKVWVQLNINATVVGSKPDDEEGEDKEDKDEKVVAVEGQD